MQWSQILIHCILGFSIVLLVHAIKVRHPRRFPEISDVIISLSLAWFLSLGKKYYSCSILPEKILYYEQCNVR